MTQIDQASLAGCFVGSLGAVYRDFTGKFFVFGDRNGVADERPSLVWQLIWRSMIMGDQGTNRENLPIGRWVMVGLEAESTFLVGPAHWNIGVDQGVDGLVRQLFSFENFLDEGG